MAKYISPVTCDNYMQCWSFVERKYARAKRSLVIGKLVGILGELAFLVAMLFITVGGLYSLQIKSVSEFLESIPGLIGLWEAFSRTVFTPGMALPVKFAVAFLAAYAVPTALCVGLAALVYILYHPIHKKPTEDMVQNANTMADRARKARSFSFRARDNIATACDILYLVLIAALFTAVILVNLDKTDVLGEISEVFPVNNMLVILVGIFVVFFSYSVLDNVFVLLNKWLFFCRIPYSLLADTERFRLFAGENMEGTTEEEVSAKRAEEAKEKRASALDLERQGEYARAKLMFLEAALAGDAVSMDNYARHCIIARHNEEAIFWLQSCVDTGEADAVTIQRLRDMRRGKHISVKYH